MAKRGTQSDQAIGVIAVVIGFVIAIGKILLAIWPFILIGLLLFLYFGWQKKKLKEHKGNWKTFYEKELKSKVRVLVYVIPFLILIGVCTSSEDKNQEDISYGNQIVEKRKIELENKQELIKRDSSEYFLSKAIHDFDQKKYKKSLQELDSAILIFPENYEAKFKKGEVLQKRRKYKDALVLFEDIETKVDAYRKSDVLLEKGKCLLKLRKKEKAAIELYKSVQLNNPEALKLYEKANPYRRKISHYVTRCCDGTTSSATGRGACSHHGGVCNWNEPIYIKERKYKIE